MKKLLLAIATAAVTSAQATVIQFDFSNDVGFVWDAVPNDFAFSGLVSIVTYNNGDLSITDGIIGKYAIIDLAADKFYISTTNNPASTGSVLTGSFGFDVTGANFATASGYTLHDVSVNNSIGSLALTEFNQAIQNYGPNATYTFSFQNPIGNGQISSVPEPTSIGLLGAGLMGLAFGTRRRKGSRRKA